MEIVARLVSGAQVAEIKSTKKVVNLRVAVDDCYRSKGGEDLELTPFYTYPITATIARRP